jgi:two-component system, response regulator, stage 0 sporulation protein F
MARHSTENSEEPKKVKKGFTPAYRGRPVLAFMLHPFPCSLTMQGRIVRKHEGAGGSCGGVGNPLIINLVAPAPPMARLWLCNPTMVTTNGLLHRKRILIVDDDPSIRYMLGRILLDEGYDALAAANGRESLQIAAEEEVDLVLLDLKMPGMNGQEVMKELIGLRPGLPVIMMTAYPGPQLDGGLNGVSALLQKPLDFPILLEAIKMLLAQVAACEGSVTDVRKV